MALKIEIIGNNLVVTETGDNSVKLERPVGDVYGICEVDKFKIFTRSQRGDLLYSKDYVGLVNSTGAALDKAALTNFFRTNLGFSSAGSAASSTIKVVGSSGAGNILTATLPIGVNVTGYQWYADEVAIVGATSKTYVQKTADRGKVITVGVTGLSYKSPNGIVVTPPTVYLAHIVNATRMPTSFLGSSTQMLCRTRYTVRSNTTSLARVALPSAYFLNNDNGLEKTISGANISASVVVGGVNASGAISGGSAALPVTWTNSTLTLLPSGQLAYLSDPIPGTGNLTPGTILWLNAGWECPNGIIFEGQGAASGDALDDTNGEIFRHAASGMDMSQVYSKALWVGGTSVNNARYGASLIVAETVDPAVLNIGTSISAAIAESANGTPPAPAAAGEIGDRGIIARAVGRTMACAVASQGGSTLNQFKNNNSIRMQLAPYFSHVVTDHLCNDIRNDNITAAAAVVRLQEFAAMFSIPVWATTQLPHVSGAVTQADGTDQTPTTNGGYGAKLPGLNALIRAGIPGIAGYFDLNAAARLGSDETRWYADGRALLSTPDLLHPATFLSQRVVTQGVVDTALLVR